MKADRLLVSGTVNSVLALPLHLSSDTHGFGPSKAGLAAALLSWERPGKFRTCVQLAKLHLIAAAYLVMGNMLQSSGNKR